jgi:hypothetical protein
MKPCRTCQRDLPLDSFTSWKNPVELYYALDCKPCAAAKRRAQRTGNPEYQAYQRDYYQKNREAVLPRMRVANLRSYHKMKDEAVDSLGGVCCACGHEDRRVLQIDHVNGGGGAERKRQGSATTLRRIRDFLRDNPTQAEYQLLCANCHALKTLGHAA